MIREKVRKKVTRYKTKKSGKKKVGKIRLSIDPKVFNNFVKNLSKVSKKKYTRGQILKEFGKMEIMHAPQKKVKRIDDVKVVRRLALKKALQKEGNWIPKEIFKKITKTEKKQLIETMDKTIAREMKEKRIQWDKKFAEEEKQAAKVQKAFENENARLREEERREKTLNKMFPGRKATIKKAQVGVVSPEEVTARVDAKLKKAGLTTEKGSLPEIIRKVFVQQEMRPKKAPAKVYGIQIAPFKGKPKEISGKVVLLGRKLEKEIEKGGKRKEILARAGIPSNMSKVIVNIKGVALRNGIIKASLKKPLEKLGLRYNRNGDLVKIK